ncbi:cytochrome c oxidase subunit 1 [Nowakowskiella sp. JEL0407]|nr:cytochrome c oxidase subunit 1 [Nowakowskiella sp. JEL0407]
MSSNSNISSLPPLTSLPVGTYFRVTIAHKPTQSHENNAEPHLTLDVNDLVELSEPPTDNNTKWLHGINRSWGLNNGQTGIFPIHKVKLETWDQPFSTAVSESPNTQAGSSELFNTEEYEEQQFEEHEVVIPTPVPPGTTVVVKEEYERLKSDEISLVLGETIVVLESPDGGWWRGMKNLGGKEAQSGWFPATMVTLIPQQPQVAPQTSNANKISTATHQSTNLKHSNSVKESIIEREADEVKDVAGRASVAHPPLRLSQSGAETAAIVEKEKKTAFYKKIFKKKDKNKDKSKDKEKEKSETTNSKEKLSKKSRLRALSAPAPPQFASLSSKGVNKMHDMEISEENEEEEEINDSVPHKRHPASESRKSSSKTRSISLDLNNPAHRQLAAIPHSVGKGFKNEPSQPIEPPPINTRSRSPSIVSHHKPRYSETLSISNDNSSISKSENPMFPKEPSEKMSASQPVSRAGSIKFRASETIQKASTANSTMERNSTSSSPTKVTKLAIPAPVPLAISNVELSTTKKVEVEERQLSVTELVPLALVEAKSSSSIKKSSSMKNIANQISSFVQNIANSSASSSTPASSPLKDTAASSSVETVETKKLKGSPLSKEVVNSAIQLAPESPVQNEVEIQVNPKRLSTVQITVEVHEDLVEKKLVETQQNEIPGESYEINSTEKHTVKDSDNAEKILAKDKIETSGTIDPSTANPVPSQTITENQVSEQSNDLNIDENQTQTKPAVFIETQLDPQNQKPAELDSAVVVYPDQKPPSSSKPQNVAQQRLSIVVTKKDLEDHNLPTSPLTPNDSPALIRANHHRSFSAPSDPKEVVTEVVSLTNLITSNSIAQLNASESSNISSTVITVASDKGTGKWSDDVPDSVLSELSAKEKMRQTAMWELICTEKDYVRDLKIVVEHFMKPFIAKKLTTIKNIDALFSNIEQLLSINEHFLQLLEARRAKNPIIDGVGDIFISMTEYFISYTQYCSNHSSSLNKMQQLASGNKQIRQYLDEIYKTDVTRGLNLASFLIKPVQRICKYPLLLKEIMKYTDENNEDYFELKGAAEKMHGVISIINEGARQADAEGVRKVVDIQNAFTEKINIQSPTRYLVREDALYLYLANTKKPRRLFLFNDMILLARKDWRDKLHLMEKAGLNDIRVFDVNEEENSTVSDEFLFEIEIAPTGVALSAIQPTRYLFSCPSEKSKVSWLEAYKNITQINVRSKRLSETNGGNNFSTSSVGVDGLEDEEEDELMTTTTGSHANISVNALARFSTAGRRIKEDDKKKSLVEKIKIDGLNAQISLLEEKLSQSELNNKKLETDLQELTSKMERSIQDFQSLQTEKVKQAEAYAKASAAAEKSKQEEIDALRRVVSTMREKLVESENQVKAITKSKDSGLEIINQKNLELKKNEQAISQLQSELSVKSIESQKLSGELVELRKLHSETCANLKSEQEVHELDRQNFAHQIKTLQEAHTAETSSLKSQIADKELQLHYLSETTSTTKHQDAMTIKNLQTTLDSTIQTFQQEKSDLIQKFEKERKALELESIEAIKKVEKTAEIEREKLKKMFETEKLAALKSLEDEKTLVIRGLQQQHHSEIMTKNDEKRLILQKAEDERLSLSRKFEEEKRQLVIQYTDELQDLKRTLVDEKRETVLKIEESHRLALIKLEEEKFLILKRVEEEKRLAVNKADEDKLMGIKNSSEEFRNAISKLEDEHKNQIKRMEEEKRQVIQRLQDEKLQATAKYEEEKQSQFERLEQKRKDSLEKVEAEMQILLKKFEDEKSRISLKVEEEKLLFQKKLEEEKRLAIKLQEEEKITLQTRLNAEIESFKVKLNQSGEQLKRTSQLLKDKDNAVKLREDSIREKDVQIQKLEKSTNQLQSELNYATVQLESVRNEIKSQHQQHEKNLAEKQCQISRKDDEISTTSKQIHTLTEKNQRLVEDIEKLKHDFTDRQLNLEKTIRLLQSTEEKLAAERNNLNDQYRKLDSTHQDLIKSFNSINSEYKSLTDAHNTLKNEALQLKETISKQSLLLQKASVEKESFTSDIKTLNDKLTAKINELHDAQITLKEHQFNLETCNQRLNKAEQTISELERNKAIIERDKRETKERLLKEVKELEEKIEKFKKTEEFSKQVSFRDIESSKYKSNADVLEIQKLGVEINELKRKLEKEEAQKELFLRLQKEMEGNKERLEKDLVYYKDLSVKLDNELKEKTKTVEDLNKRINEQLSKTKPENSWEREYTRLEYEKKQLEKLYESIQLDLRKAESETKAHKDKIQELKSERDGFSKKVSESQEEIKKILSTHEPNSKNLACLTLLFQELAMALEVPIPANAINNDSTSNITTSSNLALKMILKIQQSQTAVHHLESQLSSSKTKLTELEKLYQDQSTELSLSKAHAKQIKSDLQTQSDSQKTKLDALSATISNLQSQLSEKTLQNALLSQSISTSTEKLTSLSSKLHDTETKFQQLYEKYESTISQSSKTTSSLQTKISVLEREVEILTQHRDNTLKRLDQTTESLHISETEKTHLQQLYTSLQDSKINLQKLLDAINSTSSSLATELENERAKCADLQQELQTKEKIYQETLHKNTTAQEFIKQYIITISEHGQELVSKDQKISELLAQLEDSNSKLAASSLLFESDLSSYSQKSKLLQDSLSQAQSDLKIFEAENGRLLREVSVLKMKLSVLKSCFINTSGSGSGIGDALETTVSGKSNGDGTTNTNKSPQNEFETILRIKKRDELLYLVSGCKKAVSVVLKSLKSIFSQQNQQNSNNIDTTSLKTLQILKFIEQSSVLDITKQKSIEKLVFQMKWILQQLSIVNNFLLDYDKLVGLEVESKTTLSESSNGSSEENIAGVVNRTDKTIGEFNVDGVDKIVKNKNGKLF